MPSFADPYDHPECMACRRYVPVTRYLAKIGNPWNRSLIELCGDCSAESEHQVWLRTGRHATVIQRTVVMIKGKELVEAFEDVELDEEQLAAWTSAAGLPADGDDQIIAEHLASTVMTLATSDLAAAGEHQLRR